MIVKCVENLIENVCTNATKDVLHSIYKRYEGEDEELKVGRLYVVYSLFKTDRDVWFLIRTDSKTWHPLWYPSYFFDVVDSSHSAFWIESRQCGVGPIVRNGVLFSFREYTEMDCFYHNLIDASEIEVEIFKRYMQLIKDEAVF